MKKFLLAVICMIFLGGCFVFYRELQEKEYKEILELQAVQEEINTLEDEKDVLEQELTEIQIKNGTLEPSALPDYSKNYLPQYCLAVISPTSNLKGELKTSLKGYDCSGLLVFTDLTFPGSLPNLMSQKQFAAFTEDGWKAGISVGSYIDFKADQSSVESQLRKYLTEYKNLFSQNTGITPEIVWLENNQYRTWMDPILLEYGFSAVVNENSSLSAGESQLNLIPASDYLNVSSDYLRNNYSHYQMMTIDCRPDAAASRLYSQKRFQEFIDYMIHSSNEGKLTLDSPEDFLSESSAEAEAIREKARKHADALAKIQEKTGFSEITEEGLLNRIAEIEDEIKNLYRQ